jgi:hypothetical protein
VRREPRCLLLSPVLQEPFRSSREAQYPKDRVPCNPLGDQCSQSDEISVSSPAHTLSLFPRMCFMAVACHSCAVPRDWARDLLIARLMCRILSPSLSPWKLVVSWEVCRAVCSSFSQHEVDLEGPSKIVSLILYKVVYRQLFFRSVAAEVYASNACSMIRTVRVLAPGGFFYYRDGWRKPNTQLWGCAWQFDRSALSRRSSRYATTSSP